MFCDLGQMVGSDWQLPSVKHVFLDCSGDFYDLLTGTRFLTYQKVLSGFLLNLGRLIFLKIETPLPFLQRIEQ